MIWKKDDNVFRDNKSYTVIETRKDGIKFQNSKLEKLSEEYTSILDKYEREQKTVIEDMIKVAGKRPYYHIINANFGLQFFK